MISKKVNVLNQVSNVDLCKSVRASFFNFLLHELYIELCLVSWFVWLSKIGRRCDMFPITVLTQNSVIELGSSQRIPSIYCWSNLSLSCSDKVEIS